jgi:hypothetical protein
MCICMMSFVGSCDVGGAVLIDGAGIGVGEAIVSNRDAVFFFFFRRAATRTKPSSPGGDVAFRDLLLSLLLLSLLSVCLSLGVTFVCRIGDFRYVERSCHLAERNRTTVVTKGLIKSKKNGPQQRTKQMQHARWVQGDSGDPSTGFGRKTDARKCRFDDEIVVLALGLANDFQMRLDASSAANR